MYNNFIYSNQQLITKWYNDIFIETSISLLCLDIWLDCSLRIKGTPFLLRRFNDQNLCSFDRNWVLFSISIFIPIFSILKLFYYYYIIITWITFMSLYYTWNKFNLYIHLWISNNITRKKKVVIKTNFKSEIIGIETAGRLFLFFAKIFRALRICLFEFAFIWAILTDPISVNKYTCNEHSYRIHN